jgi:hypothetical protein
MENRPLFFYQPLYDLLWGAVPNASMVKGDYKLIWFFGDYIDREQNSKYLTEPRLELYNLTNDVGEKINLSALEPKRTEDMQSELKAWILNCGEKIPGLNPNFDPARWDQRVNPKKKD